MNPQLKSAIANFLANEFHLTPEEITPEADFTVDFKLTPDQLTDLLVRLQEALEITLPEEKIAGIITVNDLYEATS